MSPKRLPIKATMPQIEAITNIATTPQIIVFLARALSSSLPKMYIAKPQKKNSIAKAKTTGIK